MVLNMNKNGKIHLYLLGGLGNQMFQFSTAYAFSEVFNIEFVINYSFLTKKGNHTIRDFGLNKFENIDNNYSFGSNLGLGYFVARFARKFPFISKITKEYLVLESDLNVSIDSFDSQCEYHLIGYWQNLDHFVKNRQELLKLFNFNAVLRDVVEHIISLLKQKNSVAIHVRQGDYQKQNSIHKILDKDYYSTAINEIERQNVLCNYFIFGQNLDFLDDVLNGRKHNVFKVENNEPIVDMAFISMAHYVVTANSTFSWWGAWLNEREDKVVYAPKDWYEQDGCDIAKEDFIPEDWRCI